MAFCGPDTAKYFERCGAACGMPDWRAVRGGISDAMTYAMHGIPSVNVSAGYEGEHTEDETMNIRHGLDTVRLLYTAIRGFQI
ncbi:hypothetical protein MO973_25120 [Paenibacillus sp. TRM 82003]|nr:hypothetical protein [Paenibacillus sp. TRM 82003]